MENLKITQINENEYKLEKKDKSLFLKDEVYELQNFLSNDNDNYEFVSPTKLYIKKDINNIILRSENNNVSLTQEFETEPMNYVVYVDGQRMELEDIPEDFKIYCNLYDEDDEIYNYYIQKESIENKTIRKVGKNIISIKPIKIQNTLVSDSKSWDLIKYSKFDINFTVTRLIRFDLTEVKPGRFQFREIKIQDFVPTDTQMALDLLYKYGRFDIVQYNDEFCNEELDVLKSDLLFKDRVYEMLMPKTNLYIKIKPKLYVNNKENGDLLYFLPQKCQSFVYTDDILTLDDLEFSVNVKFVNISVKSYFTCDDQKVSFDMRNDIKIHLKDYKDNEIVVSDGYSNINYGVYKITKVVSRLFNLNELKFITKSGTIDVVFKKEDSDTFIPKNDVELPFDDKTVIFSFKHEDVLNKLLPGLAGYYIDTGRVAYNTWGKKDCEWQDAVNWYLDLEKGTYINKQGVENECRMNSLCSETWLPLCDNDNYAPIYYRIGKKSKYNRQLENGLNCSVLAFFSCGKGRYYNDKNVLLQSEENGILLPGGLQIFYDPANAPNRKARIQSDVFYKNIREWKRKYNEKDSILIGSIGGEAASQFSLLPGDLEQEQVNFAHESKENLEAFIEEYCRPDNKGYREMKKFILMVHTLFDVFDWDLEGHLNNYPGYILLIMRAYKDLNNELCKRGYKDRLWFSLTLPCDLNGLNSLFLKRWRDLDLNSILTEDKYQNAWLINYMIMALNPILWRQKFDNIHDSIIDSPFNDQEINGNESSLTVIKKLLGVKTKEEAVRRAVIVPWLNRYEPNKLSTQMLDNSLLTNEDYLTVLCSKGESKGITGIIPWSDRQLFDPIGGESKDKLMPVSNTYDIPLTIFSSTGDKMRDLLDIVGFKEEEVEDIVKVALSI